jgi:hypothetical protein
MRRKPATSTLNNFTSAWNKLIETAVARGYISERVPVPKLTARGEKRRTRPAFTEQEVAQFVWLINTEEFAGALARARAHNGISLLELVSDPKQLTPTIRMP